MRADPRGPFGREAEKYLASKAHGDAEALAVLAAILPEDVGRALDVGTGAGHMAFTLAPRADRVVAFDPTPEMLAVTRREARARLLDNIACVLGRAETLPFADRSFDVLSCRVAAHHFDGPDAFVREAARVLKPGGRFLLVDTVAPENDSADAELNHIETVRDPSHRRDWRVSEWLERIRSSGLEVQEVAERSKPLHFQDWLDRMSVSTEDQACLRNAVSGATGVLKDYLAFDGAVFHLTEMTLLAGKPGGH